MLDELYDLPANARRDFDADGFVHLSEVLDEKTVAEYEPAVTGKVIELNTMHLPMSERNTYQKAFLQVMNLWRHEEQVRELVFSRRLAAVAADLLGVDGVRLYHDQALYKEAGGGHTPWHADQYYWPLATDRSVTVWIPLQETPPEMGPLAFARGSHRFSYGRDLPISDESEAALQAALEAQNFPLVQEPFALGDVSYHLGWTFHRAAPNGSATPRRVMTVIYVDADITVAEPVNDHQRGDLGEWLGGTPVGQVPDTELNPVLYRR
ncbi:phytanoyl-CoA dioxygenase family protein [Dactylosporangium sp. CA-233914]|uniref:phytanoyl-CoA dioxygenase family protein n=1 Tax=Dactylosporangium sp. CA-233914 TaxID=3239934 RepID=UPI003D8DCE65